MSKRKELIKDLKELQGLSQDDAEVAHADADELLLMYINDVEITEVFRGITRWYA